MNNVSQKGGKYTKRTGPLDEEEHELEEWALALNAAAAE